MEISSYKLTGALIIAASAYILTQNYKKQVNDSLLLAKDALEFVKYAKTSIIYKDLTVPQIFSSYAEKSEIFSKLYRQAPTETHEFLDMSQYDAITRSILTDFFDGLGKSYKEAETALCEYTEKCLLAHIEVLSEKIKDKKRVFSAVTLFLSAAIIILLI